MQLLNSNNIRIPCSSEYLSDSHRMPIVAKKCPVTISTDVQASDIADRFFHKLQIYLDDKWWLPRRLFWIELTAYCLQISNILLIYLQTFYWSVIVYKICHEQKFQITKGVDGIFIFIHHVWSLRTASAVI